MGATLPCNIVQISFSRGLQLLFDFSANKFVRQDDKYESNAVVPNYLMFDACFIISSIGQQCSR